MNLRTLVLVTGLALSLGAGALAQPPQPQPQGDPLGGPQVRDRQVPGVNGTFGEPGGEKKRFVNENKLPPRAFRDAMETILSPEAPDNLRVTDEQRTRYRGWMDDFQKSVAAYMKEHQAELAELRKSAGEPGRRPGGPKGQGNDNPPPQNPPMDDSGKPRDEKDIAAARERLQSIMQGAPKIEDLYTKIWTELTPDQKKAVDSKLDEFRARQAKEREDRYVEQRMKKKGQQNPPGPDGQKPAPQGDQPPPRRPNAFNPDGAPRPNADAPRGEIPPVDPGRRERLMRMFSRLTPDQQDQLLQRLEQRLRNVDGGDNNAPQPPQAPRRGRGGPQGPGEPRPAPQPDDTMVPPPPPPAPPAPPQQNEP
jgi:hypothetical protein